MRPKPVWTGGGDDWSGCAEADSDSATPSVTVLRCTHSFGGSVSTGDASKCLELAHREYMDMRIGVIGSATVGQTLARGLKQHGHDVRIASRTPGKLGELSKASGMQAGAPGDVAIWAGAAELAVKGTSAV